MNLDLFFEDPTTQVLSNRTTVCQSITDPKLLVSTSEPFVWSPNQRHRALRIHEIDLYGAHTAPGAVRLTQNHRSLAVRPNVVLFYTGSLDAPRVVSQHTSVGAALDASCAESVSQSQRCKRRKRPQV